MAAGHNSEIWQSLHKSWLAIGICFSFHLTVIVAVHSIVHPTSLNQYEPSSANYGSHWAVYISRSASWTWESCCLLIFYVQQIWTWVECFSTDITLAMVSWIGKLWFYCFYNMVARRLISLSICSSSNEWCQRTVSRYYLRGLYLDIVQYARYCILWTCMVSWHKLWLQYASFAALGISVIDLCKATQSWFSVYRHPVCKSMQAGGHIHYRFLEGFMAHSCGLLLKWVKVVFM
jgi:hypothetical protein